MGSAVEFTGDSTLAVWLVDQVNRLKYCEYTSRAGPKLNSEPHYQPQMSCFRSEPNMGFAVATKIDKAETGEENIGCVEGGVDMSV